MPPSRRRHAGIPSGQPYSTVIMSCPIRRRSSAERAVLSQSRTGSPPLSVRKKIAETLFPGFSDTATVYHAWYGGGGFRVAILSFHPLRLMLQIAFALLGYLRAFLRSRHSLGLEILALRQQLAVFKRRRPRPQPRRRDRLFWAALRSLYLFLVSVSQARGAVQSSPSPVSARFFYFRSTRLGCPLRAGRPHCRPQRATGEAC